MIVRRQERVSVACASRPGPDPEFREAIRWLGQAGFRWWRNPFPRNTGARALPDGVREERPGQSGGVCLSRRYAMHKSYASYDRDRFRRKVERPFFFFERHPAPDAARSYRARPEISPDREPATGTSRL